MKRVALNLAVAVLGVLVAGGISARANTIDGASSPNGNRARHFGHENRPVVGVQYGLPANADYTSNAATTTYVPPATINFSTTQSAAAFQMAGDGTPPQVEGLNGAAPGGSFTAPNVPNQIEVSQTGTGNGPDWLPSNTQWGNTTPVAAPESGSTVLFLGLDLAILAGLALPLRRRLVSLV